MSSADVTPEQILDAVQQIPADRWSEVLHVIQGLKGAPVVAAVSKSPVTSGTDLRDSDLIGIWANRNDINGSREFADNLRRQAEQRDHQRPSNAAGH